MSGAQPYVSPEPHEPVKPYTVDYWGSVPLTNDDCWSGRDFATEAEARVAYQENVPDRDTAWIVLDGPGVHEERRNPDYRPAPDDRDDWLRETAMQLGMGLGVQAYNDARGDS